VVRRVVAAAAVLGAVDGLVSVLVVFLSSRLEPDRFAYFAYAPLNSEIYSPSSGRWLLYALPVLLLVLDVLLAVLAVRRRWLTVVLRTRERLSPGGTRLSAQACS